MSIRTTSEKADAVGLFPFLAVLLCTMGALLVLLVVMAQRVGKSGIKEIPTPSTTPTPNVAALDNSQQIADLTRKLAEVHEYEQKIAKHGQQAEKQLQVEQERLSHLEQHTRQIEHELARLTIAAKQLEATEKNRVIDQGQAERQLAHLKKLILETQDQLEEMREEETQKKSYAIVPYKGPHGTHRRPIYIECSAEGIVLQPEGIRLQGSDFLATSWPGNPLAAALRASREYYNEKAIRSGLSEPPDPYPMILIRPNGIRQYTIARAAIQSWDSDYGYEFIDSDWQLDYPEPFDPQLAQVQEHALFVARDRLKRLVQSAPSRFQGIGSGQQGSRGGGRSGAGGWGTGNHGEGSDGLAQENHGNSSGLSNGPGGNALASSKDSNRTDGESRYGALADDSVGSDGNRQSSDSAGSPNGTLAESSGNSGDSTLDRYSQTGGLSGTSQGSGAQGTSASETFAGTSGGNGQASAHGNSAAENARSGGTGAAGGQQKSIADSRGSNWAIQKGSPGSVPIRRTIQVVVREDRMALLPSRHETSGVGAIGTEISLEQSGTQISEEFVMALRERMEDWGIAGSGLYWRPVLELNMGPDASYSAFQIMRLLKDSGVEVRLPETASKEQTNAQR